MRLLTYDWAQSIETLLESERVTLARLVEAESFIPPYARRDRTSVHIALRELQRVLQTSVEELHNAQAAHLNADRRGRSKEPALQLGQTWRAAVREGLLLCPKHKTNALRVTLRGWERALHIADDIFSMASMRGYEAVAWKKGDKTLKIRSEGAELEFRIMERLARVQDDEAGSATGSPYQSYFLTTGSMSLHLARGGGEAEIMDKDGAPLEAQLEDLFDRIPQELVLDLAQNRKWGQEKAASAAVREAELQRRRLLEKEAARRKTLEEEAQNWHRATLIRQYADAIAQTMHPGEEPDAQQWLRWARTVADEVDPTSRRCDQLRQAGVATLSQGNREDDSASNDPARRTIRKGMDSPDFEAMPRVWPLGQWTT